MEFIDKIKSSIDNTIKYIFRTDTNHIFEMAYINKDDGKDIVCVPSHTMCDLA